MQHYVLQATTGDFGVLLVAGVYALALELAEKQTIAGVVGSLIATNPVLTASATSRLSETPHMALAVWALALAFKGAREGRLPWGSRRHVLPAVGSVHVLGGGGTIRPVADEQAIHNYIKHPQNMD